MENNSPLSTLNSQLNSPLSSLLSQLYKNEVFVITGPTASGKSALGVKLALAADGEIVSADSMQIYKLMDIGTAKPTEEERLGIAHHMLDVIPPWEDYSVARYVEDAARCIDDILERGKLPIIVGGTGLYIDSLLCGRNFSARGDEDMRCELEAEYDDVGGEVMLRKLHEIDPETAEKLHANDKKRIIRALEIQKLAGKAKSQHDLETKSIPPRYKAIKYALTISDREKLYERINQRVDLMMEKGLEAEVRGLLNIGVPSHATAMQAIGYKEICAVIQGECSIDEAVLRIKMESRRYAKRQLTWLRRDKELKWLISE